MKKRDAKPISKATSPKSRKSASTVKSASESVRAEGNAASLLIDERIKSLGDWRGATLARMRSLILEADPEVTEEWKWMGTPVWSHAGNVCTGETYKQVVKLTFARGASLDDPHGLFNSSLEGNTRRAIDLHEGEVLDAKAFKALIKAAVAENLRVIAAKTKTSAKGIAKAKADLEAVKPAKKTTAKKVVLLTGGNPQIAKADGDAPVQAYISAMPGWKRELGARIDVLIERAVPEVRKAVKWNSPFYGIEGQGWFLSFHVFTKYVKVTFFSGTSLEPVPTGHTARTKEARWIDIYESDVLDESQLMKWVKQAASIPGWIP